MDKNYKILLYALIILVVAVGVFAAFRKMSVTNTITGSPVAVGGTSLVATSTASSGQTVASTPQALFKASTISGQAYLADGNGMTLYVFNNDTKSQSSCYGQCAAIWPPYLVPAGASMTDLPAGVGTTTRSDGTSQFTWNGQPLYHYLSDQKPGDALGNGIQGLWHIVPISPSSL